MRKTAKETANLRIAVDTKELQTMLCCGRETACKIGTGAGARIHIGKRLLWNVEKIQAYLNSISEGVGLSE